METSVRYYEPVGKCIYCGSLENLTNEHIIPLSLNGTDVLPAASCGECAGITSKFEGIVARDMYGILRNKLGYKTRRKKLRPPSLPVFFRTPDGIAKSFQYTLAELPVNFSIAYLPPPGILTGAPLTEYAPEMRLDLVGNMKEMECAAALTGSEPIIMTLSHLFVWGAFSRLLAKIAHAFLIATYGQNGYIPFLPDIILGRSNTISHYVGGYDDDKGSITGSLSRSRIASCRQYLLFRR